MNIKIIIILGCMILSTHSINSLDENSKAIAILAWGSLVNAPRNLQYKDKFIKSGIYFPIELSCLSFKGTPRQKLTRIVDKHWGHPLSMWYTTSSNVNLLAAIDNLALREETTNDKIFYIKKIESPTSLGDNELLIPENKTNTLWCIDRAAYKQLSKNKIIELIRWAHEKNFDAAIWTGLEMVQGYDREKILTLLKNDGNTLLNTKKYILNSPDLNELTTFEKNILADELD